MCINPINVFCCGDVIFCMRAKPMNSIANNIFIVPFFGLISFFFFLFTFHFSISSMHNTHRTNTSPTQPTGSISNIDGGEYHCNKTQVRKVISGVVGAASSVTSIQVANLLRLFRIPQVCVSILFSSPFFFV